MLPDQLDQRGVASLEFLRPSIDRAQNRIRLQSRRDSFEKVEDEVFECLKLGVSGTWEGFCHGRFRVVGTGLLALTYSSAIVEYQSIKDNPHGYDETNPGRPPNG